MTAPATPPIPSSFLTGEDYMALPIPERPYLIKDLVPMGGLVNLFAEPKAGKSYLALQMASAISSGDTTFLGFPVVPGRVGYFQLDTPRSLWVPRVRAMHGAGLDMSHVHFCDREMAGVPYPFNILEHQKWLTDQLSDIRPDVLFVDTLREVFNGNENDSDVMKMVINSVVAAAPHSAIFFLSHRKKVVPPHLGGTGVTDLMNDGRGSTYVPGRMDMVICCGPEGLSYQGRATPLSHLPAKQQAPPNVGAWVLDEAELVWRTATGDIPGGMGERDTVAHVHEQLKVLGVEMSKDDVKLKLRTRG